MQLLRSVQQQAEEAEADTHRIQQREITSIGWVLGAGGWVWGGQLLTKVNKKYYKTLIKHSTSSPGFVKYNG